MYMIALVASAAVAVPLTATEAHEVRIEHSSGAVDARYHGRLVVAHRQVGAVAPGGRASTLRCAWQADVVVDRAARHPSGSTMARSITRDRVLTGSRPGWCAGARQAIDREVAARSADIRTHLLAVADEDRATLMAETDRLHAHDSAG
jgi:hypothetical protein